MNPINQPFMVYFLIFILGWSLAYWLGEKFKLKEHGIEIKPFILTLKTKKVNRFLDAAAKKTEKILPVLSNIFVVLSIGCMVFGIYILSKNLYFFFYKVEAAAPIFPAIPVITVRESLPYFLLSVVILIFIHEFAHGIVARHEKIEVKSAGVLLLAIIPGGFVEPDEESFKKASLSKKLKVLAAGSSANLIFGILIVLLLTTLFQPTGILIQGVVEDSPAFKAGLQPGDVIKAVYGKPTPNLEIFRGIMKGVKVGDPVILDVEFKNGTTSTLKIVTAPAPENKSRAIIGIYPVNYIKITPLYLTFFWIQLWSISIAIINMLPIYPLDGGSFINCLLEEYVKKHAKILKIIISATFISLLGLNIGLTFLKFGFISI